MSYFFLPNSGAKILLSTAKMITIATPPVTTVVTMLWMVLRKVSLGISAMVTGFQTQVNRFITRNTTTVARKCSPSWGTKGPWLLKVTLRWSGKLIHSPKKMAVRLARV